ncbi:MAG: hypothetical protein HY964_09020, partial [Ignavibacteriales bacterium]|nr:hypothetical protein [Ignavibacteriales bacterium]
MKRIYIYIILLIGLRVMAVSHKQDVHQYICVESYNLLKRYVGMDILPLYSHLGEQQEYYRGDRAWQRNYITTGAWREDEEDIVWHHGTPVPFFDIKPWVSITHFWDADNDLMKKNFFQFSPPLPPLVGPYENAYDKMLKYAKPNKSWTLKYTDGGHGHEWTFALSSGGTITYWWYDYLGIQYDNLTEFYKTGKASIVGYYDGDGEWVDQNTRSDILPREIIFAPSFRDEIVWELLGRMCHLLGDMSVPAHTRPDEHGSQSDTYEDWVSNPTVYQVFNALNSGELINPYISDDPIYFLMFTMQQVADHFSSNGPYAGNGDNYLGPYPHPIEQAYLNNLDLTSLGNPITQEEFIYYPLPEDLVNIAVKTFPRVIRATAGLLYWFAIETDMINHVVYKNDYNAGEIKINGVNYPSGTSFDYQGNNTISSLEAYTQFVDDYWRLPFGWQKFTNQGIVTYTDNAIYNIEIDRRSTFQSINKKKVDISLVSPQYIESAEVGGTYNVTTNDGMVYPSLTSWNGFYLYPNSPMTIEALPLSDGWCTVAWPYDGGYLSRYYGSIISDNPLQFTPEFHRKNLYPIFKKHLKSSKPTALSSNTQIKLVHSNLEQYQFINMIYESGNGIFMTSSSQGTDTWGNEFIVGGIPSATIQYRCPTLLKDQGTNWITPIYQKTEYINDSWQHKIMYGEVSNYPAVLRTFSAPEDYLSKPVAI